MKDSNKSTLLRNAHISLPEKLSEKNDILIQDGLIKKISRSTELAQADTVVDLEGAVLHPGFIDIHIHGAVGVDTMNGKAEDLTRVSKYLATQGVTAWMPTFVPAAVAEYRHAIEAIEGSMSSTNGARILGVHYEGPFVNSHQCGALHVEHFRTYSGEHDMADLPLLTKQAKHLMTLAPEVDGGINLIAQLVARGWVVSIGHTRAEMDVLERAFAAGAKHMTHFMNAMAPLHHRSPGPVTWGLLRDEVSCDVIADGVHLHEDTLKLLLKSKRPERLLLISDAIAAAGLGDGNYQIWGEEIRVTNGRTSNAQGSIAGSVISVLDAVRLMRSLGVSDTDLARMASFNPARLLGIDSECGSIEEGKRADLVVLDQEGNVTLTMVAGQKVFEQN